MYRSLEDMEKQFAKDVATMGKAFTDMIEKHFDTTNPWDQSVLAAIMTNVLAYVEVQAEQDGVNMERAMKDFYELNLVDYRNQVKENLKKVKK
jgi:hypothetical protein